MIPILSYHVLVDVTPWDLIVASIAAVGTGYHYVLALFQYVQSQLALRYPTFTAFFWTAHIDEMVVEALDWDFSVAMWTV